MLTSKGIVENNNNNRMYNMGMKEVDLNKGNSRSKDLSTYAVGSFASVATVGAFLAGLFPLGLMVTGVALLGATMGSLPLISGWEKFRNGINDYGFFTSEKNNRKLFWMTRFSSFESAGKMEDLAGNVHSYYVQNRRLYISSNSKNPAQKDAIATWRATLSSCVATYGLDDTKKQAISDEIRERHTVITQKKDEVKALEEKAKSLMTSTKEGEAFYYLLIQIDNKYRSFHEAANDLVYYLKSDAWPKRNSKMDPLKKERGLRSILNNAEKNFNDSFALAHDSFEAMKKGHYETRERIISKVKEMDTADRLKEKSDDFLLAEKYFLADRLKSHQDGREAFSKKKPTNAISEHEESVRSDNENMGPAIAMFLKNKQVISQEQTRLDKIREALRAMES